MIPEVIEKPGLSDYLEVMSVAVFQAGMSWAAVLNNLKDYRKAYKGFDPALVSKFKKPAVTRLMKTPKILHSERKILATVHNAQTILDLDAEFDGFDNYLKSFEKGEYETLRDDMQKRFEFMGDLNVYYFLFRVNRPVPPFKKWLKTIEGEHPRMAEMVKAHKDLKKSRNKKV